MSLLLAGETLMRSKVHHGQHGQHYFIPSMRLYSAATVSESLQTDNLFIKVDLTSGFFQMKTAHDHRSFVGSITKDDEHDSQSGTPKPHPFCKGSHRQ
jgi:hypothetical protein